MYRVFDRDPLPFSGEGSAEQDARQPKPFCEGSRGGEATFFLPPPSPDGVLLTWRIGDTTDAAGAKCFVQVCVGGDRQLLV